MQKTTGEKNNGNQRGGEDGRELGGEYFVPKVHLKISNNLKPIGGILERSNI